jgi:hypothetical protein
VTITVTFSNDDPAIIRSDMAAMLGSGGATSDLYAKVAQEIAADTAETPRRGRRSTKDKAGDTGAQQNVTAEPQQAIQTGGDREPPKEPEKQPEPKKLTLDDVRGAANGYIKKFGLENAQVDLQFALKDAVGVDKMSLLDADDQEQLKKAVDAFNAAGAADKRYVAKSGGAL